MKRHKLALAVAALAAAGPGVRVALAQDNPAPAAPRIEEVFVLGEFIPDEKRDTSEISNVLNADDMALLGDSDVASALERVSGLTLVGGSYIYVRGLGERYSSTLLNGSPISSPVPFQKTMPLDIVPNTLVGSLLVQKTYSPEYPGDFSGGVVVIRTKTVPEENYLILKVTTGGNSQSTDGDGLTYKGGAQDNSGWDDGTRQIPKNLRKVTPDEFNAVTYPQSAAYGNSFYDYWDVKEKKLNPDIEGEGSFGYRLPLSGEMAIGLIGAGQYVNQWRNTDTDLRRYEFTGVDGGANQTVDYDRQETEQIVDVTGFTTLGFELNRDHSLALTWTLLRRTTDTVQQDKGLSSEDNVANGTPVQSEFYQWVENQIQTFQLAGDHYFTNLSDTNITWRAMTGKAWRKAPDTRSYTYAENRDGLQEMVTTSRQAAGDLREVYRSPDRSYSYQDDNLDELGLDLVTPFTLFDTDMTVKTGASTYEREREVNDRLFRFDINNNAPDYIALETPNQLFGTPNWQNNYLSARDFTDGAANASGIYPYAKSKEQVDAYYLGLEVQVTDRWRLQGGFRQEEVDLKADAWGGNIEEGTVNNVSQNYSDTLPAFSSTLEFLENMQWRLAYSETRNRPSLLEITGSTVRNPADGNLYRGNVYLEQAELKNYDSRWEWYFGGADSMSLGAFYKEFDNPIELGKVLAQGDIYTWFNADKADLKGVEYELRKELLFGEWFDLSQAWNYFTLAGNATWMDSKVTLLGGGETAEDVPLTGDRRLAPLYSNERKLTGQSDWIGNLQLIYEDPGGGFKTSLSYNYTDERIVLVGERNAPDIIEDARSQVDMLVSYSFEALEQDLEVEFKAKNLTDEKIKWTQGGRLYEEWKPGITWSLGLAIKF